MKIHRHLLSKVTGIVFLYIYKKSEVNNFLFFYLGASHANDIGPFSIRDSVELFNIKMKILELLHYWISHADGNEIIPV